MEFRPHLFAREWVKCGHKVTIVASSFSHLRNKEPKITGPLTWEEIDGIQYIWLKNHVRYQGNGLKRALNIFEFVGQIFLYGKTISGNFTSDIVIASSTYPLDIFPAHWIARKSNAKFIYEVHDLWPLSVIELGGMSKRHPFIRLMQYAEDYAYKKVDKVVSILPNALSHMEERGLCPDKYIHVPNAVIPIAHDEINDNPVTQAHLEQFKSLKEKGNFLVGYFGSHGVANSLDQLVDTASLLKEKPVYFFSFGQGPEKNKLKEKVNKLGLKNIFFADPIPRVDCLTLMKNTDALYFGLKKCSLFRFGISPNKLFDYMYSGKPIIQAVETSIDLVRQQECGISVPSESSSEIADAVEHLRGLPESLRIEMGERGKKYVLEYHQLDKLARKFLE